jgi:mRNA interferase MazF
VVRRGEVWWGETPHHGRRPYLVLTRESAIGVLNEVLVAPTTTRIRGISSEVTLDESDGMPRLCVANFDNLATIAKSQLTERITRLESTRMDEVCAALSATAGC